jgi:hypothetical protein
MEPAIRDANMMVCLDLSKQGPLATRHLLYYG